MQILENLAPNFRDTARIIVHRCAEEGVKIVPYVAIRDPWEQCREWRKSRTKAEIDKRIASLQGEGCTFLAECLSSVGAQAGIVGKHSTNAIGGLSWHQWGEAMDCYVEVDGKPVWDAEHNGYKVYASVVKAVGCTSGASWGDAVHCQRLAAASPQVFHSMKEIDKIMRERFAKDM